MVRWGLSERRWIQAGAFLSVLEGTIKIGREGRIEGWEDPLIK